MPTPSRPPHDAREQRLIALGCALLAATLVATQTFVDPGAEAAFDAPKRLAAFVGLGLAAVVTAALQRPFAGAGRSPLARAALALAALAVAGILVAALASPRPTADALRRLALLGLALPIGASRLLDDARRRWLAGAFVGAATAGAVLALAEHAAGLRPFTVVATSGRGATGGLVGNEGQLALVLTLAAVPLVALLLAEPRHRGRRAVALAVLVAGVAVTGTVTALLALVAGTAVVTVAALGRRAVAPLAAVAVAAIALVATVAPVRTRVVAMAGDVRAGAWDDVTSNRLGPWAAALEMAAARPLVGVGPGAFGAEFVPHRLAAEMRHRTRLVIPVITSSYAEAHAEPLQAIAEWGLPAGVAAVAAVLIVLLPLARAGDAEGLALAGFLSAAAVAALSWFPVQQASTTVALLLALGRAWRRLG